MELRSNRSRSRTPFGQTKIIDQEIVTQQENHIEETVVKHAYSTRQKIHSINNSALSDEVFSTPPNKINSKTAEKVVRRGRQKTSDYSSEEGENESTSSKTEHYVSKNAEANYNTEPTNGDLKSPLQVYREAGEYWNKYPKTDYTYSLHSKDRVEIAPGLVALPNMSRRSLRRSVESTTVVTNHSEYSGGYHADLQEQQVRERYTASTRLPPLARLQPQALFQAENRHNETIDHRLKTVKRISIFRRIYTGITSVFWRIITTVVTALLVVYHGGASTLLWGARWYYKLISRVLLFDTWLLQSSSANRRWGAIITLLFLPLLLFSGWWLCSSLTHLLHGALFPPATEPQKAPSTQHLLDELPSIILQGQTSKEQHVIDLNDLVARLLENPQFKELVTQHLQSPRGDYSTSEDRLSAFKDDKRVDSLRADLKVGLEQVNKKVDDLSVKFLQERLRTGAEIQEVRKCCRRQFVHVEAHVRRLLLDLMGAHQVAADDLPRWLHSFFVARQDLESRLSNLTASMHEDFQNLVEISAGRVMDEVLRKLQREIEHKIQMEVSGKLSEWRDVPEGAAGALGDLQVQRIVKEALAVYDADKTGLVDYALESSGGQIISTRCTESYNARTAVLSVLGVPLWYPSNTPRVVITPGVTPGECWAFQNFPGFLVIQLTTEIQVSAFSLEHIPKSLAPGGRRESAPKDFTVWGLLEENDRDPWLLGKYRYELEKPSLQFFKVQGNVNEDESPSFKLIELRIESNHGNLNYTCLYRFRVHGILKDEPT